MQDPRMPQSEENSNPKLRKKKISTQNTSPFHLQGNDVREVQGVQGPLSLKTQKASKRNFKNEVLPSFQQSERSNSDSLPDSSASGSEYRALRRKYLLLEEESFVLGSELKEMEDEVKTLEDEKIGLLDQLVVLEGLIDPSDLQSQGVNSSSLDYPLLVANGTYVYTANDCVNCKCSSLNNYILQCEASGLKPSSKTWSACPALHCNLYLGNVTTSTTCNQTFCAYSGFTDKNIFTTLATESTCPEGLSPAAAPSGIPTSDASKIGLQGGSPAAPPSGIPTSDASKICLQGVRWNFHVISIQLIFLRFHLSQ